MPIEERALTMTELANVAGVTPRTIRYYIAQGLLPAPGDVGRGAHYGRSYLDRLALIKRLQREHLPLAEIRERLTRLTDDQVGELVAAPAEPAPAGDALAYVRSVLAPDRVSSVPAMRAMREVSTWADEPGYLRRESPPMPSAPRPATTERSQWDRIAITTDIEIHVRRPLDRQTNKSVDRLIAIARELLGEDTP